ncbi:glucose-methanol-choline (gmc) oxidoreductase, putative [Talaromyces stipitatus ATCC 10500]|uniref:Glucose-methanol-choline (Gmc) oxidoreductase, putative n=1 Tax=Talaromyces stipitatus (strain ATCC 10500 / CBS 375.48 / QM 6759 / NRRL 1006) TaxID=441959 RepID=B8LV10_TALSN|nr:glucose-methanol-choline (gmc) oxidoreductase, putative [Talaromyces stipitatus ATCC 10500]EED22631.1 glucose-methanol-choline (gmc) oxidoreductase, putative [Talaromyces stipitatus ATCC 10500]
MPGVGQNLQDHYMVPFQWETDKGFADIPIPALFNPRANQDFLNAAVIFDRDTTMMKHTSFFNLSSQEQHWLSRANELNLEILAVNNWHPGVSPPATPKLFLGAVGLVPQSEGSVSLTSSDWHDAPSIQSNLLGDEHGLDLAFAISYTCRVLNLIEYTDAVSPHIVSPELRPKSDSEEDITASLGENVATLWHPARTTRMGPLDDESDRMVDPFFRVRRFENLRIADPGVVPVMPNCHPASVALLIGAWASERIITLKLEKGKQYYLQGSSFLCVHGFQDRSPNMVAGMTGQIELA